MKKIEIKQRDELYKASCVILELGYIPKESMCSDKPDICIPSKDDKLIGIEVVAYSTHRYEKAENAMYKIFKEYIEERLDKRSDKRYEIGVLFKELNIPVDVNFKKVKEEIFNELDNLILHHRPSLENNYIEDITAFENPGVEHSFIADDTVVVYDELDEQTLLKCIYAKERKLKDYKAMKENKTIKEYYLVIYFPINEHAELRGYTLPNSFTTKYDRIYLVDSFYTNRIR